MFKNNQKSDGFPIRERALWLFKLSFLLILMIHQSNFALMQGVAWIGMLSDNVQENSQSFQEAIEKTFNGQNPCDLCELIQDEQSQKESDSRVPNQKEERKQSKQECSFESIGALQMGSNHFFINESAFFEKYLGIYSQHYLEVLLPPPRTSV